jgi:hypothetical protein
MYRVHRRQLIEIEDQPWCPRAVRDGLTDYLQFVTDRTEPYTAAVPLLANALRSRDPASGEAPVPVVDRDPAAVGRPERLGADRSP